MGLQLDANRILETADRLSHRIRERFPDANLGRVAADFVLNIRQGTARIQRIHRRNLLPRIAALAAVALAVALLVMALQQVRPEVGDHWKLTEVLQAIDSTLGVLAFLFLIVASAWTFDVRIKRRQCLEALHEMRALAHIIDMHQLTKDPDRALNPGDDTASSPVRTMDRAQLVRYLDYCSELLALVGKVAALHVQGFPDPVALSAVDDIEDLTTSLSRKIWQKIVILESASEGPRRPPRKEPANPEQG